MHKKPKNILEYTALKASIKPEFASYWLTVYRVSKGISEGELAAYLGISLDNLTSLALCAKPKNQEQLTQISERVGADPTKLAEVFPDV